MTQNEFAKFAMAMRTMFPKEEKLLPTRESVEMWFELLKDIPYYVASTGLQKWAVTHQWSPSIADIREMAVDVTKGAQKDWGEAWQEVQNAISRFGYYRADEAVESLSPLTRQVVKRLGFEELCTSETPEINRANFRMIYQQVADREKQDAQIPQTLKNLISQTQTKMIEGG